MSVIPLRLEIEPAPMPHDLEVFLEETSDALSEWESAGEPGSFVPADYVLVYDALCALRSRIPPGSGFLEWGSGLGMVTMLASALGWQARGIEHQAEMVQMSRHFASLFDLPARFHLGSFFPGDRNAAADLEKLCRNSDLIYVYPWPDQEIEIFDLFDRRARTGAVLLTYFGLEDIRVFTKNS